MKQKKLLVLVSVIAALAAYAGLIASIAHWSPRSTKQESRLLKKDYAMVFSGVKVIPLRPDVVDPNNTPVVTALIAKQGLQLSDLTSAETRFLSLMFTKQGGSGHSEICRITQAFIDQHGHLPRNAAQIALSHSDPENFITTYPRVINPATNRLYDTFEAEGGPLAINIRRCPPYKDLLPPRQ